MCDDKHFLQREDLPAVPEEPDCAGATERVRASPRGLDTRRTAWPLDPLEQPEPGQRLSSLRDEDRRVREAVLLGIFHMLPEDLPVCRLR